MDIGRLLNRSWEAFMRQPLNLIVFYLVGALLMIVPFLNLVIMGGLIKGMIRVGRGEEVQINDLFSEMDRAGEWIIGGILAALAVGVGFALLFIPGIIVGYLLSMGPYIMAEKRVGFMDAFKESFDLTSKNIGSWLVILLIAGVINAIGGAVAIGWIVTGPITMLVLVFAYQDITGGSGAGSVYTGAPEYDPNQMPPPPPAG